MIANWLNSFESRLQDRPFALFLLALIINTIAFLLSHNYIDGDTHSRTYMAIKWLEAPFFIYMPNDVTWVFAPLHCYLNAAALYLWYNPPLVPRLISLLLTTLTVFPFYHSVRFEFGSRAAFYSTISLIFCTLFIHPAAIAASEGINLFLLFSAILAFLHFRRSRSWGMLLLSAALCCLATMMRYDSGPIVLMMGLLALVDVFHGKTASVTGNRSGELLKSGAFFVISHAFAIMWMMAQWIKLGHPFHMTINSLDIPVIERNFETYGAISVVLYHVAFFPGILLLTLPVFASLSAGYGIWKLIVARRFPTLFWLFVASVGYYYVTFVFTFARYPLARFITIPVVLFACFSGLGVVQWLDRESSRWKSLGIAAAFVLLLAVPITLSFFSQPSSNAIAEKLRAVSPLTNPPDYYGITVSECSRLLNNGSRLVLDNRNFNQRLLYLDLYRHHSQIDARWITQDSLRQFINSHQPPIIVRADYPKTDNEIFDKPCGSEIISANGLNYRMTFRSGIYAIYTLDTAASKN